MKTEAPEKIWLLDDVWDGIPCLVWSDDPDPAGRGEVESVEYIRVDVVEGMLDDLAETAEMAEEDRG